ncbi:hypothetical protein EV210_11199 [Anaerospora hongkongensis]|uniref:Uncharacterized protein n=1 Tax=Anaerospora hongkongensis TaxID=244830 RepID=A0A4R1PUJ5_9FIRM|nr:hypothetical protein [Anaerospora hongkongensis]TCL35633.1 hypothetical protein EV210_11199 [Anaerospora hongkongensis]
MAKQRKKWYCQDCRCDMMYDLKSDSWVCPQCKVYVSYPIDGDSYVDDEVTSMMRDLARTHGPTKEYLPSGPPAKGSGSKNKGRSRKGEMQKLSIAQINLGLAGTSKHFESR